MMTLRNRDLHAPGTAPLDWSRDAAGWPHRECSRFVDTTAIRWHVQVFGQTEQARPVVILLHGTGASTHSWRAVAPLLAQGFTVVVPDLPGHGFTAVSATLALSMANMARGLAQLMHMLGLSVDLAVGHSAGAAVLAWASLHGYLKPRALLSVNGALLPMRGLEGQYFVPLARVLAQFSLVPTLFSMLASKPDRIRHLLAATGSQLDEEGVALYLRLVRSPRHIAGVLAMMANWDLAGLARALPRLEPELHLLVGANDQTIAPYYAQRVQQLVANAQLHVLPGLGHLAHEQRPDLIASWVVRIYGDVTGKTIASRRNGNNGDRNAVAGPMVTSC